MNKLQRVVSRLRAKGADEKTIKSAVQKIKGN